MGSRPQEESISKGKMNHLVTGGAGLIGSHLMDALVARCDTDDAIEDVTPHERRRRGGVEVAA